MKKSQKTFFEQLDRELPKSKWGERLEEELRDHIEDALDLQQFSDSKKSEADIIASLGTPQNIGKELRKTLHNQSRILRILEIMFYIFLEFLIFNILELLPNRILIRISDMLSFPYFYPDIFNETGEIRLIVWELILVIPIALIVTSLLYSIVVPKISELFAYHAFRKKLTLLIAWCVPIIMLILQIIHFFTEAVGIRFADQNDWGNHVFFYVQLNAYLGPVLSACIGIGVSWFVLWLWDHKIKQTPLYKKQTLWLSTMQTSYRGLFAGLFGFIIILYIIYTTFCLWLPGYHLLMGPRAIFEELIFTFDPILQRLNIMPSFIIHALIILSIGIFALYKCTAWFIARKKLSHRLLVPEAFPWFWITLLVYIISITFCIPPSVQKQVHWLVEATSVSSAIEKRQFGPLASLARFVYHGNVSYWPQKENGIFTIYQTGPAMLDGTMIIETTGPTYTIDAIRDIHTYDMTRKEASKEKRISIDLASSDKDVECLPDERFPQACLKLFWKGKEIYRVNQPHVSIIPVGAFISDDNTWMMLRLASNEGTKTYELQNNNDVFLIQLP